MTLNFSQQPENQGVPSCRLDTTAHYIINRKQLDLFTAENYKKAKG